MTTGPADDPRSDQMLIAALNRGEASAFEHLYRRHHDWAWRIARRFSPDDASASDVVQETFLHLLGRFPGFRLTARLTTYLYPVIRSTALTAARRSQRLRFTPQPPERASPPPAAKPSPALETALAQLPETQREVLLMRAVDQMTLAEIALALAIPEGTVKSRLHNALAALRAIPGLAELFDPA